MNTSVRVLNVLVRLCGTGAMVLGLAFWLGYAGGYVRWHMMLGIFVVLGVWALAGVAWTSGVRRDVVVTATATGLVNWVLGLLQTQLVPGDLHWIVRVAHLTLGAATVALGAFLAVAISRVPLGPSHRVPGRVGGTG